MKIVPLLCLLGLPCGFFALGCTSGKSSPPPPVAPTITSQPSSQTAKIGDQVTVTVSATGTGTLTYQWTWNGIVVSGATGPSYTTPAVVPSDNQSLLAVNVTNSVGSITSSPAVLTVSGAPRPPKLGDQRFKDVDAFPPGVLYTFGTVVEATETISAGVGTTLCIGVPFAIPPDGNPLVGGWTISYGPMPQGGPNRTITYLNGDMGHLQLALQNFDTPDTVIGSFDLDARENNWAMEVLQVQDPAGGYTYGSQTLAPENLQAAITQEGAAGRVVTAISLDGGQATYISYGWKQDPSTVYETSVLTATKDTVASVATALAQAGYIITATGGNDLDGFILVGTRVKGDTTPRPLKITQIPHPDRGYAPVASIALLDSTTNKISKILWIYEM